MNCSMPVFPVPHYFLEFAQAQVHQIYDVMKVSHLLLSPSPQPSIFPSIRAFFFFFQWVSSSNEYSELISFRIDWFDLLVAQGALRSILQHHSSKALIFRHSAFFIVQLSQPYMSTGKTIALTRWTFVGKVMFLLFNMLSRLIIAFLPRSKSHLISWLQSPSAVILEPKNIKSLTVSICIPVYLPWNNGIRCHDLSILNVEF